MRARGGWTSVRWACWLVLALPVLAPRSLGTAGSRGPRSAHGQAHEPAREQLLGPAREQLLGPAHTAARRPAPDESEPADVPRQPDVRAQLLHARNAKAALAGTLGSERMKRRRYAARAYAAVRVYFPEATCAASEACFRAGELLRGGGDLEQARGEFEHARQLCPAGPFRARAVLEIGHVERRLGDAGAALEAYEGLYTALDVPPAVRDDAMLWAGRVYHSSGRHEDAHRLWERAARSAEDPVDRVHAFDLLALSRIEADDLEAAAGVLERCRVALRDVAQEETRLGARVRAALLNMRARDRLRRAIARRRGTLRIDAEDSE